MRQFRARTNPAAEATRVLSFARCFLPLLRSVRTWRPAAPVALAAALAVLPSLMMAAVASAAPPALAHHYTFDDNASDSIGSAHGLLQDGAVITNALDEVAIGSGALNLDAAGAHVEFPVIELGSRFTIMAWVLIREPCSNIRTIVANAPSGGDTDGFKLFLNDFLT